MPSVLPAQCALHRRTAVPNDHLGNGGDRLRDAFVIDTADIGVALRSMREHSRVSAIPAPIGCGQTHNEFAPANVLCKPQTGSAIVPHHRNVHTDCILSFLPDDHPHGHRGAMVQRSGVQVSKSAHSFRCWRDARDNDEQCCERDEDARRRARQLPLGRRDDEPCDTHPPA